MLYNKRRIAPILGSLILALLLLITHTVYGADQVELTSFPQDLQLYPRDLATNRATITIEGTVTGSTSIVVEISHEGTLVQTLEDTDGGEFGFIVQVPTNLIGFDFVAYAVDGEERAEIARAENVVAGDVYAINGQSNATAQSYEGLANPTETNDFVRTFGSGEQTAAAVQADDAWYVADGDSANAPGAIGQWALRMGNLLVQNHGVPVAIINGGYEGQPIEYFARNEVDSADLSTNYGQLMYRLEAAGVRDSVRAMFWYQGENDFGNTRTHITGFDALYAAWQEDYPSLERTYVFQIADWCIESLAIELRNAQRLLGHRYDDITVLSTNGLTGHLSDCHYMWENGYKSLGERAFNVMSNDLYDASLPDVAAPDVEAVYFSNPEQSEITIQLTEPQAILEVGPEALFRFFLDSEPIAYFDGDPTWVEPDKVVLALNREVTSTATLDYYGDTLFEPENAADDIVNGTGHGMLAFQIVVEPFDVSTLSETERLGLAADTVYPITTTTTTEDGEVTVIVSDGIDADSAETPSTADGTQSTVENAPATTETTQSTTELTDPTVATSPTTTDATDAVEATTDTDPAVVQPAAEAPVDAANEAASPEVDADTSGESAVGSAESNIDRSVLEPLAPAVQPTPEPPALPEAGIMYNQSGDQFAVQMSIPGETDEITLTRLTIFDQNNDIAAAFDFQAFEPPFLFDASMLVAGQLYRGELMALDDGGELVETALGDTVLATVEFEYEPLPMAPAATPAPTPSSPNNAVAESDSTTALATDSEQPTEASAAESVTMEMSPAVLIQALNINNESQELVVNTEVANVDSVDRYQLDVLNLITGDVIESAEPDFTNESMVSIPLTNFVDGDYQITVAAFGVDNDLVALDGREFRYVAPVSAETAPAATAATDAAEPAGLLNFWKLLIVPLVLVGFGILIMIGLLIRAILNRDDDDYDEDDYYEEEAGAYGRPVQHAYTSPSHGQNQFQAAPPSYSRHDSVRPLALSVLNSLDPLLTRAIIQVDPMPFTIGRENCTLIINNDPHISRRHAEIVQRDGQYFIVDLQSANGVFVAGERIPANRLVPIRKGTEVRLGQSAIFAVGDGIFEPHY